MNQKTCNPEGLKAYPEALRNLPYCNWRYEEVKGQQRKVPYNSITGAKASSSRIETMTTLERALAVVARYDGVIVKVSGKVGFIDIDKCVREDGALDERAQRILSLLPGTMVEYSPSGRGLHVILQNGNDSGFQESLTGHLAASAELVTTFAARWIKIFLTPPSGTPRGTISCCDRALSRRFLSVFCRSCWQSHF